MTCGLLWLAMLLAGASVCLGGCGQKGPLYLPDAQQQHRD
ncbi:MAG: lipoprotein [Gammaproteobacteria bacterium]|jgi:predicted small lipoprotein YifL